MKKPLCVINQKWVRGVPVPGHSNIRAKQPWESKWKSGCSNLDRGQAYLYSPITTGRRCCAREGHTPLPLLTRKKPLYVTLATSRALANTGGVKNLLLCLTLGITMLFTAEAQMSVEVTLPQNQFLPGENLVAAVRITNRSGQKLKLGAEEDWLRFDVESRDGSIIAKLSEPVVVGEFELDAMQVATKRVDLAPHFNMTQLGRYSITATVKIKAWDRELVSSPKSFDLIHGAKLWEQEFGVPHATETATGSPEVRKYILEQANYLKGQLRMYLRLTDSSGARTFRVFPIGQMVSFSRPEAQLDKSSNLHVLYANGPHSFSYTVFNPEGDLTARDIYEFTATRPRLRVNDEGQITVNGGARRVTASLESTATPPAVPAKSNP